MKNILTVILFCAIVITTSNIFAEKDKIQKSSKDAKYHYENGNVLGNAGKFEEAKKEYCKAIALDPDFIKPHYNLGNIYLGEGNNSKALYELNIVIILLKNNSDYTYLTAGAYHIRGMAQFKLDNFQTAILDFTKSISYDSNTWTVYFFRAKAYDKVGRHKDAEKDKKVVIELKKKKDPIVHYNKGTAHMSAKRYEKAIEEYTIAIEIKPDFIQAYNNRSVAYHNLGQFKKAKKDQEKIQALLAENKD